MAHELVFFPDYRLANPYQRLLYSHAGLDLHPRPGTIADAVASLRRRGPLDRTIFHLHWDDAVYRNEPDEPAAWAAAQDFLIRLETFADAGGRTLWTLHNTAPHDGRYLAVHEALLERLPQLVDLVHVHSHAAAAWAAERLGVPAGRIAIVPHGNYLPLYRPVAAPAAVVASRAELGLPETGRVLLLFGRLGPYKGTAALLTALATPGAAALWLLIAGKEVEPIAPLLAALPAAVSERVRVRGGFVPEAAIEPLFAAADAVVLPYRAILTSGTALLAMSLRRPVVAPAFPSLRELLEDGRDALLYEPTPNPGHGLAHGLGRLAALGEGALGALQEGAYRTALRYDWRQSGLLLGALFQHLLTLRRPSRLLPTLPGAD